MPATGGEAYKPTIELEPTPRYPVLLLGGGHGTGARLAVHLSQAGFPVFVGSRTLEKAESVCHDVSQYRGAEATPFIADITQPDKVEEALNGLGLAPNVPLHYFAIAAGGFDQSKTRLAIGRPTIPLLRKIEALKNKRVAGEPLTEAEINMALEALVTATEAMKASVLRPGIDELAEAVNNHGLNNVGQILVRRGHLGPKSTIATLSSTLSDSVEDPNNPELYQGPWI